MKVLFLCLLLSLFGNKPSSSEIFYRQLTWADFRGKVPPNLPDVAARSYTLLVLETTQLGNKNYFLVEAHFNVRLSFVQFPSDAILRHEQTHFDIAQLTALRLGEKLKALQGGDDTAVDQADSLYQVASKEKEALNSAFDDESAHGLNHLAEMTWEYQIQKELNSFDNGRNKQNP